MRAHPHVKSLALFFPIASGAIAGSVITVMLLELKPVWVILLFGGPLVLLPTFLVKDPYAYWLGVFFFVLPFDVSKNLGDTERVLATLRLTLAEAGGINTPELRLTDLALLALLALWFLRLTATTERLYLPRLSYLAIAYIFWSAIASLRAPYPYLSVLDLVRHLKFFLIYLCVANTVRSKQALRVITVVLLSWVLLQGSVTSARYYFQYFDPLFGDALGRSVPSIQPIADYEAGPKDVQRGFGTINSPSETATHLEYLLPLAFILALGGSTLTKRATCFGLLIIGLVGLYVTFSRAPVIGLAAGIAACTFVVYLRGFVSKRNLVIISYGILVTIVALSPIVYFYLSQRPENIPNRLLQYKAPARMIQSHPILGVGLNNSTALSRSYAPEEGSLGRVHSQYLVIASETGLVGLLLFLLFFGLAARDAWRLSGSTDREIALVATGLIGSFVSVGIHVAVDIFYRDPLYTLLFCYAGLIMAMKRLDPTPGVLGQERPNGFVASPARSGGY